MSMYLFDVQNGKVTPYPSTLLISPYTEIWERDGSTHRSRAIKDFSYIEFMVSKKSTNPYKEYPGVEKHVKICQNVIKDVDYQPDELVIRGIKDLTDFQEKGSNNYLDYIAAEEGRDKIRKSLNDIDLSLMDKNGRPVYKSSDIATTLKLMKETTGYVNDIKKAVEADLFDLVRNRGDKKISPYADLDYLKGRDLGA